MTSEMGSGPPGNAVLALRDIEKSFGPISVLRGVDFDVRPGRFMR
jgi:ABC-type sugar transport system ATPase subunit